MIVVRWMLVLPAAVLGAILANLLMVVWNVLSPGFAVMSPRWIQFASSIAGGYLFVVIGALVAPSYRLVVSIVLAVLLAMYTAAIATVAFVKGSSDPLWWVVVCLMAGLIAAGFGVRQIKVAVL